MRPLDNHDLIIGGDISLDDDSEVGTGPHRLGKPAWKLRVVHPDTEPPTRDPWFGYLEDERSDRPTLADERIVHCNTFCRQVFPELAVLKRTTEFFFPPAHVFDGVGVEGLIRTAVGLAIRLVVSLEIDPAGHHAGGNRRFPNGAHGRTAVVIKLPRTPHIHRQNFSVDRCHQLDAPLSKIASGSSKNFVDSNARLSTPRGQHGAKPRLTALHVLVSFARALKRKKFIHRTHAGQRAEGKRLLGIDGATGRPAQDRATSHEQRYPRDLKRLCSRP